MSGLGLSVVLWFDGSVRYGPDNADPRSATIGYVAEAGRPLLEGSRELSAFVSSTHVEFRALLAGVEAVSGLATHRDVSSVHVRGDAAAVIEATDPERQHTPGDSVRRRRVGRVRAALSPFHTVTYRQVSRSRNDRAHTLAARAHSGHPGR